MTLLILALVLGIMAVVTVTALIYRALDERRWNKYIDEVLKEIGIEVED